MWVPTPPIPSGFGGFLLLHTVAVMCIKKLKCESIKMLKREIEKVSEAKRKVSLHLSNGYLPSSWHLVLFALGFLLSKFFYLTFSFRFLRLPPSLFRHLVLFLRLYLSRFFDSYLIPSAFLSSHPSTCHLTLFDFLPHSFDGSLSRLFQLLAHSCNILARSFLSFVFLVSFF